MARPQTAKALLDEIEREALNPNSDISSVLRKCVSYSGRMNAPALKAWALKELKGYDAGETLPPYRMIAAPVLLDASIPGGLVTGQQVPFGLVPDGIEIEDEVPYGSPLAGAYEAVRTAQARGDESTRFGIPGSTQLLWLMNSELHRQSPRQEITRIYWSVHVSAILKMIDVVRTTVIELVAEIRSEAIALKVEPGHETVDRATRTVLRGLVNVNTVYNQTISGSSGDVTMVANRSSTGGPVPEGRMKTWMYWVTGGATVVAAVPIVLLWLR